jgi:hypothetical protein
LHIVNAESPQLLIHEFFATLTGQRQNAQDCALVDASKTGGSINADTLNEKVDDLDSLLERIRMSSRGPESEKVLPQFRQR